MKVHKVKSWPEFYAALDGGRPFDVRKNDRNYAPGDEIVFCEYDDRKGAHTGRELRKVITHVHEGVPGGIPPLQGIARGWCVLGLADKESAKEGR